VLPLLACWQRTSLSTRGQLVMMCCKQESPCPYNPRARSSYNARAAPQPCSAASKNPTERNRSEAEQLGRAERSRTPGSAEHVPGNRRRAEQLSLEDGEDGRNPSRRSLQRRDRGRARRGGLREGSLCFYPMAIAGNFDQILRGGPYLVG
jgi:hypothetical protein